MPIADMPFLILSCTDRGSVSQFRLIPLSGIAKAVVVIIITTTSRLFLTVDGVRAKVAGGPIVRAKASLKKIREGLWNSASQPLPTSRNRKQKRC